MNNNINWQAVMEERRQRAKRLATKHEFDPVTKPEHYNTHPSGIETIRITEHETFLRGNIIKYVMRAPYKGNELQDLEKAQWYLSRELDRVKGNILKGKHNEA